MSFLYFRNREVGEYCTQAWRLSIAAQALLSNAMFFMIKEAASNMN